MAAEKTTPNLPPKQGGSLASKRAYNKWYRSTPRGAACFAWNRLTTRAGAKYGHRRCYAAIEVRMTREEFMAWAVPQYEIWFKGHPGITPSVDRIDSTKHYEIGNIRLISRSKNCSRTSRNKVQFAPEGTLWCCQCKRYLPIDSFYRLHKPLPNGSWYPTKCKECARAYAKQHYWDKRDK